jgi:hypothetical protein
MNLCGNDWAQQDSAARRIFRGLQLQSNTSTFTGRFSPATGKYMHDLVFISLEDWDDIWRRNQFLCSGLAKRFPESKILFFGRPRLAHHAVRHGRSERTA